MNTIPKTVGVLGGGRMGAGIAQVFAAAGAQLVVTEPADPTGVLDRVARGLEHSDKRGLLDDTPQNILRRIEVVGTPSELPTETELVIEAVPEVPEIKVAVLAEAENRIADTAVLASNTSSLSIGELASVLRRPERFLGTHFFNPVPASALLEIVRTDSTDDKVVTAATEWATELGKTPIVVNDSPGFATSRLGVMLGLEAIRMVEEGVTDVESIDRAMELGYRHPVGPLRSTDLVGLDIRLAVAEYLHDKLGERFAPPSLLRTMVARGDLGKKTGQGFYAW
ncbi:3-hydroxyacyl-CoA dehydrogenase family protein [Rhodococcus sp. HM1]|uniref:3-hydroxyacyl-CoA dehydrogenase family protein n=1 Tax=unclassified Rhodococcus (in: high G+C Gram-positive bacteria) TaxID=192944 RepID=UPI0018CF7DE8|nr:MULTISPECIES: 3-hydroxyacyl-CoA dehydrogenase family protein [unclassified Rhodococcus (in: high G+C Gram-positive bacteria)]MBH0121262.1 3-hydroxyacyl-CoA dehydrogenase family protein [Rhodococcus sp. CX]MCK8671275.1 3-hydroxyacyl-CoA dehydrogenase family protein [Rhodococcus sp. HM1]